MRTTLLGFSLGLMMVGGIMSWAVTADFGGFNVNRAGIVIVLTGMALATLSFVPMRARQRRVETSHESSVDGGPVEHEHEVVIEENGRA